MNKTSLLAVSLVALLLVVWSIPPAFASAPVSNSKGCCLLKGIWTDNYSYHWDLHAFGNLTSYTINGTVDSKLGSGGAGNVSLKYTVTGSGSGTSFTITASRTHAKTGCTSFTYVGSFTNRSSTAGGWTNTCEGSGTFTMTRG
jgi:hypothetical protein